MFDTDRHLREAASPQKVVVRSASREAAQNATKMRHPNMMTTLRAICLSFSILAASAWGSNPDGVVALSAIEDAGGATQEDLNLPMLKALEKRTVDLFTKKMREALRAQRQGIELPPLQVASHYVDAQGRRLAVIKISSPPSITQVHLYGIVGKELRRVACVRTSDFAQSIPLFYGSCGEKIKQVFGVDPHQPK